MTDERRRKNLEVPAGPVDCVIDTDTYNEIDDQFAVSYMLKSEKCRVKALCAAPFFNENSTSPGNGMERSYEELLHLLTLMGREEEKKITYRGSAEFMKDENTPVESDAADAIIALAEQHSEEDPLYVVAIGAITNVASAILKKREIVDKMVVVFLGGHDLYYKHTKEFNMFGDPAASRIVFASGVPLVQLPCCGVVTEFTTTEFELRHWLVGKNPLCDYLAKHTIEAAESYAAGKAWSRVIWDVTAVAWLLNDGGRFMASEVIPALIPEYDGYYSLGRHPHVMRRVTEIHRDALMTDLFKTLAK